MSSEFFATQPMHLSQFCLQIAYPQVRYWSLDFRPYYTLIYFLGIATGVAMLLRPILDVPMHKDVYKVPGQSEEKSAEGVHKPIVPQRAAHDAPSHHLAQEVHRDEVLAGLETGNRSSSDLVGSHLRVVPFEMQRDVRLGALLSLEAGRQDRARVDDVDLDGLVRVEHGLLGERVREAAHGPLGWRVRAVSHDRV